MDARTSIWLQNLIDEREGAALYEGLAALDRDATRAAAFRELAAGERRHGAIWERKLREAGAELPEEKPSSRVRTLLWLARRLGVAAVLPLVVENEQGDADKYLKQGGEAAELAEEERAHERVLTGMKPAKAEARASIAGRERWHRGGRSGSIRAAIFGMNDGLVSNLALVLGVAGAGGDNHALIVAGAAGLLAGAASMAAGEYSSVASQRDLLGRQIELERRELADAPEEETAELALILHQKGVSPEQASRTARELMNNPEQALDTLVREELGLDPEDLGSPLGAAGSSFVTFSVGAIIPLLPFFFSSGRMAIALACGFAGLMLTGVGGMVGFLSGTGVARSAGRMVGLAALAATITYAVGQLFGKVVS